MVQEYFDSSSESLSPIKGRKNRPGINAKPTSNVCIQLRYPHFSLRQMTGFIGQNVQYHHLSFEQFIAGKLATISTCDDASEKEGRLELLQHITAQDECHMAADPKRICSHSQKD